MFFLIFVLTIFIIFLGLITTKIRLKIVDLEFDSSNRKGGYLNEKFTEYKHLQEFVPKNYICLHTSGHADFNAIKQVCETVKAKVILPIHGENPEAFKEMDLKDCVIKIVNDNEEIKI